MRARIYALPSRRRAKIGRVDIGAQEMTGNAGGGFDCKHVLCGQALGRLKPLPDGGLSDVADPRELRLRAGQFYGPHEGFVWGYCIVHTSTYSIWNNVVNSISRVLRYSIWNR